MIAIMVRLGFLPLWLQWSLIIATVAVSGIYAYAVTPQWKRIIAAISIAIVCGMGLFAIGSARHAVMFDFCSGWGGYLFIECWFAP